MNESFNVRKALLQKFRKKRSTLIASQRNLQIKILSRKLSSPCSRTLLDEHASITKVLKTMHGAS